MWMIQMEISNFKYSSSNTTDSTCTSDEDNVHSTVDEIEVSQTIYNTNRQIIFDARS